MYRLWLQFNVFKEFLFSSDWNTLPGARAIDCIITAMFQFTQWHVKGPLSEMLHSPPLKKTEKKESVQADTQVVGIVPLGLSGSEVIATLSPGITFAELQ